MLFKSVPAFLFVLHVLFAYNVYAQGEMCQPGMLDTSITVGMICSVSAQTYDTCNSINEEGTITECNVDNMKVAQEEGPDSDGNGASCSIEQVAGLDTEGVDAVIPLAEYTACCEALGGSVLEDRRCQDYNAWITGLTSVEQCSEEIWSGTTYEAFIAFLHDSFGCCTDGLTCCDANATECFNEQEDYSFICEDSSAYNGAAVFEYLIDDSTDSGYTSVTCDEYFDMVSVTSTWPSTCDTDPNTAGYIRVSSIAGCCGEGVTACNTHAADFCADPDLYEGTLHWDDGTSIVSCDQVVYTYFGDDIKSDCEDDPKLEVSIHYSTIINCCGNPADANNENLSGLSYCENEESTVDDSIGHSSSSTSSNIVEVDNAASTVSFPALSTVLFMLIITHTWYNMN